jgi:GT2 family glycosyltransferase
MTDNLFFLNKKYWFTFIENTGNNGFSDGCNLVQIATETIFFLNPDTKLTLGETLLQTAVSQYKLEFCHVFK